MSRRSGGQQVNKAPCETPERDQIGFDERDHFLLVGSEFVGSNARVVDMTNGVIVHRFPKRSTAAIWVPMPATKARATH